MDEESRRPPPELTHPATAGEAELPHALSAGDADRAMTRTQVVPLDGVTPPLPADERDDAATEESQSPTQIKGQRLGDYFLLKRLGKGATGSVYLAQQQSLERQVALKVLSKHLADDPTFVLRFQREARLMAKLDHPHIVRAHAVGEERGYHYLAMEFVDGHTLGSWLVRLGRIGVGDALHVVMATLDGLQHAHDHELIHRDIKPDNILITNTGVVKVADLGLAKGIADDMTLTRTGHTTGTPLYMSPEQTRDAKYIDGRSDIYSVGCMLYRCLTGRAPFEGDTFIELFEAKQRGTHVPARKLNDEVPERLDHIIERMLAKDPKFRYQNCADLWRDLDGLKLASPTLRFIGGNPEEAAALLRPVRKAAPVQTTKTPLPAEPRQEAEFWYVHAINFTGVRKLTRKQVLEMIEDINFDWKAEASRTPGGEFRVLGSYREFEAAVRGRLAKIQAERRATRHKSKFQEIVDQHGVHQDSREAAAKTSNVVSWVIWIVAVAVVIAGLYLGSLALKYAVTSAAK
ncbi:MAG: serine/threonine protein kinase [Gemmataceae bacterium]